ncbi:MAG TPA: hypothetical protein DEQ61_11275, partial [Streptomyces sp.]|nr:hypothetical protein [Streptomyces sp.]
RRDLAMAGYLPLRAALEAGENGPYLEFQRAAARLVRQKVPRFRELWQAGALAAAQRTGDQLAALEAGDVGHLADATARVAAPTYRGGYGMCGRRDEYELPGATLPYESSGAYESPGAEESRGP